MGGRVTANVYGFPQRLRLVNCIELNKGAKYTELIYWRKCFALSKYNFEVMDQKK